MRDGFIGSNSISLAKPPRLEVVRELTIGMNRQFAKLLTQDMNKVTAPVGKAGPGGAPNALKNGSFKLNS